MSRGPSFGAAALALLYLLCCVPSAVAVEDRFASDPKLRRFVDIQHGEALAIELARLVYRTRWNEVLDQSLYLIAPRGTWDEKHPAWTPAREALARALREESVRWLAANRAEVRLVVNEQSIQVMTEEEERRQTTEFFESPAGNVFLTARETFLRERAYGLPLEIEGAPVEAFKRAHADAEKALVALPEDREGKVVYDFFHGGPGDKLLNLRGEHWGRIVANVFSGDLEAFVCDHKAELAAAFARRGPGDSRGDRQNLSRHRGDGRRSHVHGRCRALRFAPLRRQVHAQLRPRRSALERYRRGGAGNPTWGNAIALPRCRGSAR